MPKRYIDGDAIARSRKLMSVQPVRYRAEIALLITQALANGSFEVDPNLVHRDLYSYNRPDMSVEDVAEMLNEYERVRMLFRWFDADGKVWGYWLNSHLPGRLPSEKEILRGYKLGAKVPKMKLAKFITFARETEAFDVLPTGPVGNSGGPVGRVELSREEKSRVEQRSAAPPLPLLLSSPSPSNGEDQDPDTEAASIPVEMVPADSTEISPVEDDSVPSDEQPGAALRKHLHPLKITNRDFDPVDYAFTRSEEVGGLSPQELQRTIWYHWRTLPASKSYWADPEKGKITSIARLTKMAEQMAKQVPEKFRLTGSVYHPIWLYDPACTKCGGVGSMIVPHPYYPASFGFERAQLCQCTYFHPAPWRLDHTPALEM